MTSTATDQLTRDISGTISDFVVGLTFADIPEEVAASAKLHTVECLGHMLAGLRQPVGQLVTSYVKGLGARPQATVYGAGFMSTVAEAAYANGTLAHSDELEAYGTVAGTGLIPPIAAGLAVAEWLEKPGSDYVTAVVAGVEVQGRLGMAAPGAPDRGFMGFSLVGPAGAAVAAGKLGGLDSTGIRNALGTALPLSGGSLRGCGYMSHVHEAGVPARTGVWAAELASRGFTGCPDYLDGPHSWGEQFAAGGRGYHPERITADLGAPFFLASPGAAPKRYGSCGLTHQSVEGLVDLMTDHGISPDDIAGVELVLPPFATRVASFEEPETGEQAKFSIRQAVAGVLVEGVPRLPYLSAFTDEAARDRRYADARRRITLIPDERAADVRGFDSQTVTVVLRDGRRLSRTVEGATVRGRDARPLTTDERLDLFRSTVDGTLDASTAEAVIEAVMQCELSSMDVVSKLLTT
ncbi:MAG: MmgE/PrpD family protein [Acidimicrobiia bacterium]